MTNTVWDLACKLVKVAVANNIELSKAHLVPPKKLLLLLDMNGTLLYRSKTRLHARIQHAFVFNQQYYYYRPRAQDLITWLVQECSHLVNVAFYTSMSNQNATAGATYLTANISTKLHIYDQAMNKSDPSGEHAWSMMRDMTKIWSAVDTPGYGFNATNTLMIDDSNTKMREHPGNLIVVPEFTEELVVSGADDTLEQLQNILLQVLRAVDACIDVDPAFDVRGIMREFQWEVDRLFAPKKL